MKTFQIKGWQTFAALILFLFVGTSLMANVKIYQKTGYKGKVLVMSPGEYSAKKFSRHLFRKNYCSIKLPKGYCIDVDYAGKGWKGRGYKSYSNSISKLKCGFKKIRIRVCGGVSKGGSISKGGSSSKGSSTSKGRGSICMADWAVQFYEHPGYQGQKGCVTAGTRGQPSIFRGYPKSMKIRGGYEIILYKNKRVVKKLSNNVPNANYAFDMYTIQRKGSGNDGGHPEGVNCGPSWAVQFYKNSRFNGPAFCFSRGNHNYRPSTGGYPSSIKVRSGYKVILKHRGRVVLSTTRSLGNINKRFDKIEVAVDRRF